MSVFKEKLKASEVLHGCWLNLGSPVSAEIVGQSGFDWVLIDLEHGAGDMTMLYQQLQALSACPVTPLVRVDHLSGPKVQQILDFGALGIMFPQIRNAEEALQAAGMMYYPPRGTRGMAKMTRASGFGSKFDEYYSTLNQRLINIIQIETLESLHHLDAIAGIEDVDVLFVGPSDLSMALGIFEQFNHRDFLKALDKIAEAASKAGKVCGTLLLDVNNYELYSSRGYRFIASGADSAFVAKGARAMAKALKEKVTGD
jgi:4-hydroxy-2-oxoheptanedioate aldolase